MSIKVRDFTYVPGENDGEYIRLLNEQIERQKKLLNKAMAKIRETEPSTGQWIDYSDDGYVECPFCHSATTCDGNKDELHFCFSCGARMNGGAE